MTAAEKLRAGRQRAGLSQSEAAALCAVPLRTYQGWELGRGARSVGPRDALAALDREERMVGQHREEEITQ